MAAARPGRDRGTVRPAPAETAIDTSQIVLAELPAKEFPGGGGYRVAIAAPAHEAIWKHASQSVEDAAAASRVIVEVGGILVGNVYRDDDGPYLEITAAVAGEHTDNQGTQMTFTPETWAQVTGVKDRLYPKDKIVGWYHTHPDFGIFLSDMDKFTHRQFFSPPWTTAFVVDPVRKTEGFFVWSGGETIPISEYWVGQQRRERVVVVQETGRAAREEKSAKAPESAVSRATFALSTVLGILALIFVFGYVYLREVSHSETEKFVLGALDTQKAALLQGMSDLDRLRQDVEASRKQTGQAESAMDAQIRQIGLRLNNIGVSMVELQARVAGNARILDQIQGVAASPAGAPKGEVKK